MPPSYVVLAWLRLSNAQRAWENREAHWDREYWEWNRDRLLAWIEEYRDRTEHDPEFGDYVVEQLEFWLALTNERLEEIDTREGMGYCECDLSDDNEDDS
jgi:hypothetical protein